VQRIGCEAEKVHGEVWITAGREVENYIPNEALKLLLNDSELESPDSYCSMFDFIEANGGNKFSGKKTDLAKRACKHLTRAMIESQLDLAEKLDRICERIRAWNRERPSLD